MSENSGRQEVDLENEVFPLEPRYHPIHTIPRKLYDFLASARLAMFLLVVILVCSVVGVTVVRGQQAGDLIFNTFWFNSVLVSLVVNVICCFFGRVWHRRLTVISFGMILFHLSFVTILLGIVYNSLYYFRASIRLTEGETLPNGNLSSYDHYECGRLFSFSKLRGETSLIRMHRGFRVANEDKRAAYEISVGDGSVKKSDIIYPTHNLTYKGFTYYTDREGYSILLLLSDVNDKVLIGGHLPLQSLRKQDGTIQYSTGTKDGAGPYAFPQQPSSPLMAVQLGFQPSKQNDRDGNVPYLIRPLSGAGTRPGDLIAAEGNVAIGEPFNVLGYRLIPKEIRYWVGMTIRYEPGKPIVLASLWVGLAGMLITTIGRMVRAERNEKKKSFPENSAAT